MRRPRPLRLAALSVLLVGTTAMWTGTAGASCAAPSIDVRPTSIEAGGVVEVRGSGFGTDCNDTGGPGPIQGEPEEGIDVRLAAGATSTVLAEVDADCDYELAVRVQIPPGQQPGPAVVSTSQEASNQVTVQVTSGPPAAGRSTPPTTLEAATSGPGCARPVAWTRWAGAAAAATAVIVLLHRRRRPSPARAWPSLHRRS